MTNPGKFVKFLAAVAFLFALALNVKVTLDDPFVLMTDNVIAQTTTGTTTVPSTSTTTSTSWWDSLTHRCVPNCICNKTVYIELGLDGNWRTCSWSINARYLSLSGTSTECHDGQEVAHCWDCTNMDCVVPNEDIIAALNAIN